MFIILQDPEVLKIYQSQKLIDLRINYKQLWTIPLELHCSPTLNSVFIIYSNISSYFITSTFCFFFFFFIDNESVMDYTEDFTKFKLRKSQINLSISLSPGELSAIFDTVNTQPKSNCMI